MSLSCIVKTGSGEIVINPSSRVDSGEDYGMVAAECREHQINENMYCGDCFVAAKKAGLDQTLFPVKFRNESTTKNGVHRRCCFTHPPQKTCIGDLGGGGEGSDHLNAKAAIARDFEVKNGCHAKVNIEPRFEKTDEARLRIPDVMLLYPNGSRVAIEVQLSLVTSAYLDRQTEALKQHDCPVVVWYLGEKNFTDENRAWCALNGIQCHRLWFVVEGDRRVPRWDPLPSVYPDPKVEKKKAGSLPSTNGKCDHLFSTLQTRTSKPVGSSQGQFDPLREDRKPKPSQPKIPIRQWGDNDSSAASDNWSVGDLVSYVGDKYPYHHKQDLEVFEIRKGKIACKFSEPDRPGGYGLTTWLDPQSLRRRSS